jgi:hypothetical protein
MYSCARNSEEGKHHHKRKYFDFEAMTSEEGAETRKIPFNLD